MPQTRAFTRTIQLLARVRIDWNRFVVVAARAVPVAIHLSDEIEFSQRRLACRSSRRSEAAAAAAAATDERSIIKNANGRIG